MIWGGVVWRADRDGDGTAEGGRPGCRSYVYSLSFSTLLNEDPKGNPHPRAGHAMWIVRR